MWWYQWERWERLDGWNITPETLGPSGQDQAGTGRIGASQKKQEGLSGGWRIPKPLTKTKLNQRRGEEPLLPLRA